MIHGHEHLEPHTAAEKCGASSSALTPHAPVHAPAPTWHASALAPSAPSVVLAIQRAAGNQAVVRMLDAQRPGHPLAQEEAASFNRRQPPTIQRWQAQNGDVGGITLDVRSDLTIVGEGRVEKAPDGGSVAVGGDIDGVGTVIVMRDGAQIPADVRIGIIQNVLGSEMRGTYSNGPDVEDDRPQQRYDGSGEYTPFYDRDPVSEDRNTMTEGLNVKTWGYLTLSDHPYVVIPKLNPTLDLTNPGEIQAFSGNQQFQTWLVLVRNHLLYRLASTVWVMEYAGKRIDGDLQISSEFIDVGTHTGRQMVLA
jgi:hypothetical protein